jgi:hypothetical protein
VLPDLGIKAHKGVLALRDHKAVADVKERRAKLVQLVHKVLRVLVVQADVLANKAHKVSKDQPVLEVAVGVKDHKAHKVTKVFRE